mgnify:CR=1 FL=1
MNSEKGHYIVEGYISNLDVLKKRAGDQYLFINNRPIKSKMIHNSIISSYSSLIQRGEYPFFSINIKTSPSLYDINVHPMKKEILFKEEWKVNQIIKESIKNDGTEVFKSNNLSIPLKEARENFEKEYLTTQLKKFGGNISKTAKFVGMERSALHRKLKGLGVKDLN